MSDYKHVNSKLKDALMYILQSFDNVEELGMTKISKLLYFSDFNHYKENFEPITGEEYVREEHGPLPTEVYNAVEVLQSEGKISTEKESIGKNREKWMFEVKDDLEFPTLENNEKETISRVISKLGDLSASELEELSHKDNPWQVTKPREPINYDLVFYRSEDIEQKVE